MKGQSNKYWEVPMVAYCSVFMEIDFIRSLFNPVRLLNS